jgi:tetratricopeptide (TPR) repeat protein
MARSKKSKGAKRAKKVLKREKKRREEAKRQAQEAAQFVHDDDLDLDEEFDDDEAGPLRMPDRRAIEGAMWRQFGMFGAGADPALQRAQNLMYDAFDEEDPDERIAIAEKAIEISPDCADAWVLLAEEAESLSEATELYEKGVEAGRRAIGKEFDEYAGKFWGILTTRPYMRARAGLADCLWAGGRREQSIEHYLEMLQLNPGDNQGLRYVLVPRLLESGRTAEAEQVLNQYDEDSAMWLYNHALVAFQKSGDNADSRELVANANEENPFAPKYLTGQRMVPMHQPDSYSPGSDAEARIYAAEALAAWKMTPGAVAWLRKVSGVGLGVVEPEPASPSIGELRSLPQAPDDSWRVDVRQLPADTTVEDDIPLWSVVVIDQDENDFVSTNVLEAEPGNAVVWDSICSAMTAPHFGEPRRPGQLDFLDERLLDAMKPKLKPLGIDAVLSDDADEFNARYEEMAARLETPLDHGPLTELPLAPEEAWQLDCRQLGVWLANDEGDEVRPWAVLATCPTEDCIVAHAIRTEQPSLDDLWNVLEHGMRRPGTGDPRRPGRVQVRSADQRLTLEPRLAKLGVACESGGELDHWDFVYDGLARSMEGQRRTKAFAELPDVSPAQVTGFFEAAAEFYRRAPWRRAPAEAVVELKFSDPVSTWDAVVMGQSGLTFGLAMYDDGRTFRKAMMAHEPTPEVVIENTSALSLTYGEQHELAPIDLDAADQFGWPVAAPEAYPVVFRVRPERGLTSPSAKELRVLEAALRTVPEFVAGEAESLSKSVAICDQTFTVELRWVVR